MKFYMYNKKKIRNCIRFTYKRKIKIFILHRGTTKETKKNYYNAGEKNLCPSNPSLKFSEHAHADYTVLSTNTSSFISLIFIGRAHSFLKIHS